MFQSSKFNAHNDDMHHRPLGAAGTLLVIVLGLGVVVTVIWTATLTWFFLHLLNVL